MQILKETENVIIYKSENGIISYKFKIKDEKNIIEAIK